MRSEQPQLSVPSDLRSRSLAIHAENLRRSFVVQTQPPSLRGAIAALLRPKRETRIAVHDISLSISYGEMVAVLGPNGAGKSTLIKMLTGILPPSSGYLRVNGRTPHRDRERNARTIGAVFGHRTQLWWDLSALDSFHALKAIYQIDADVFKAGLRQFDELLDLSEFWMRPVRHLSLGQRVRCDLAAALLHDPAIIFLDEPTIGMDAVAKDRTRMFLRHLVANGKTIILTSHDLNEVEKLSDRVVLVKDGRVRFDGSIAALRTELKVRTRVTLHLSEAIRNVFVPGAEVTQESPHSVVVLLEPGATLQAVLADVVARLPIADVKVDDGDLEELLRHVYLTPGPSDS